MTRRLPLLILLLAGCAPIGGRREPLPAPVPDDPIAAAAEASVHDYASALAESFEQTADESATAKSAAELVKSGAERNKTARDKAFEPLFSRLNDAAKPDGPYDPDATAKAFRSAADGFRRAAK